MFESMERGPVVMVPVDSLLAANSPRGSGEDPEHVRMMADAPGELPPIIVQAGTMRVIDGMHRLRAARSRGRREIGVRFFEGDEADAFVLAVQTNIAHGLPLSLADRKAAASRILVSHPQWSDRRIASVTGLAAKTIAEIRRRGGGEVASRVGQDGRVRPINSAEGRKRAGELLRQDPGLSLRQVARMVGISPETVRDVRGRLRCAADSAAGGSAGSSAELPRPQPVADAAATPDWVPIVRRLGSDPALRFSESGRILLRSFQLHAMAAGKWQSILDSVPPHCRTAVAEVARGCAVMWQSVADCLEQEARDTA